MRSAAIRATPSEVATTPVCRTCQAEIDGHGRTYYPDLDEAMRAYGTFEATKKQIRDALAQVDHDEVWLPNSASYIALGHQGLAVAWVGKGYVEIKSGEVFLELPNYSGHLRDGGVRQPEWVGETCERCFQQKSRSGSCGCDE